MSLVNRCLMCKGEEESINQLLLHCIIAGLLRQLAFLIFGLHWMMHSLVRLMLISWNGARVRKRQKKV